jgi:hypothetical protein
MWVAEPFDITEKAKYHDYPIGVTYHSPEIMRLVVMAENTDDAKSQCQKLIYKSISGEYEFNKILDDYAEHNNDD